jgi:hypothetical protein
MRLCSLSLICCTVLFAESVAGLKWTPPAEWKSSGTTSMRAATYPVTPVQGDHDPAECAVYFFGLGQGGSIQDNIERWEGQFKAPGDKPSPAKVTKITIHGLPVTTIDVSGEYSGMAGPSATAPVRVSGYRLQGAIDRFTRTSAPPSDPRVLPAATVSTPPRRPSAPAPQLRQSETQGLPA